MSGEELDGMAAFMQGKIRAEGDIMLSTKVNSIFPVVGFNCCNLIAIKSSTTNLRKLSFLYFLFLLK